MNFGQLSGAGQLLPKYNFTLTRSIPPIINTKMTLIYILNMKFTRILISSKKVYLLLTVISSNFGDLRIG